VCPAARFAMVYVIDESRRDELAPEVAGDLQSVEGLDLVARRRDAEALVWSRRGELHFAPGGDLEDARGRRWSVDGQHEALDLSVGDGRVADGLYPDALWRLWSALECPHAGDVLVSAAPGYEFVDWGGADHVGGGSHGSLHGGDSQGALLMCGTGPATAERHGGWSISDVAPLVLGHFSLSS
jgi:hypothetical protein